MESVLLAVPVLIQSSSKYATLEFYSPVVKTQCSQCQGHVGLILGEGTVPHAARHGPNKAPANILS